MQQLYMTIPLRNEILKIKKIKKDNFLKQLWLLFGNFYLSKKPYSEQYRFFSSLNLVDNYGRPVDTHEQRDSFAFLLNILQMIKKSYEKLNLKRNMVDDIFLGLTTIKF